MFRRRRRNKPRKKEVKGERVEISARKYYPYLDFFLAFRRLPIERIFVPEVALRAGACGA